MNKKLLKNYCLLLSSITVLASCSYSLESNINKVILSQNEISSFEKEYNFKTKALTLNYLNLKFKSLLGNDNGLSKGTKIVKDLEYARLKGESIIPAQEMFVQFPDLYNSLVSVSMVISERAVNQPFDEFLGGLNPYPSTPIGLNNTNITSTSFTANWAPVADAISYDIIFDNGAPINTTNTSYTFSSLNNGSSHNWKVRANKSNNISGSYSNPININTLISMPMNLSTTNITSNSFIANWSVVSGATSYDIIIDNGTPINTTNTSYTASGLQSGNHTWKVRAVNSNTNSSYTSDQSVEILVASYGSCKALKDSGFNTNGVYTIDTDNTGPNQPIQVYCDMTTSGGGWTMVVAQFEEDVVTNWNEGIQADYDPSLATKKGFALKTAQIPTHTQTAFGLHKDPTYIDYVNFVYSTGNIPKTNVNGLKTANQYHIHRSTTSHYNYHNPEETLYTNDSWWHNTLTLDKIGVRGLNWAFSPNQFNVVGSSYSMNGVDLQSTNEPNTAWTVWVR